MEEFNPRVPVQPESFRQDRIKLDYGDWYLEGSETLLREFFEGLRPQGDLGVNQDELGCWFFNAPSGGLQNPRYFGIRKQSSSNNPAPVFGGKLQVQSGDLLRQYQPQLGNGRHLKFSLFLNPTRFVRYQAVPTNYQEPFSQWEMTPNFRLIRLTHYLDVRQRSRERSLDGNDNFLPRYLESVARNDVWRAWVRYYLESTFGLLEGALQRVARQVVRVPQMEGNETRCLTLSFCSIRRNQTQTRRRVRTNRTEPLFYLNEYETFVDFHAPMGRMATDYIREIVPILSQFRGGQIDRYRTDNTEAVGFSFNFDGGTRFKIYAKSPYRIRIEVSFNLASKKSNCASILHDNGSRSRSTQRLDTIMTWFNRLDFAASLLVNEVFEFLASRMDARSNEPSYVLPIRIMGILQNEREASLIMSLLLSNGSITLRRRNDPLRQVVNALVEEGILVLNGGDRNSCRTYSISC